MTCKIESELTGVAELHGTGEGRICRDFLQVKANTGVTSSFASVPGDLGARPLVRKAESPSEIRIRAASGTSSRMNSTMRGRSRTVNQCQNHNGMLTRRWGRVFLKVCAALWLLA